MRYETIHTQDRPYSLWTGSMSPFAEHRHGDFEFAYCYDGEFEIIVDRVEYKVRKGQLLLLPPMASHERTPSPDRARTLNAIFGSSFLKAHFAVLSNSTFPDVVYTLDMENETHRALAELLHETIFFCQSKRPANALLKTGNLYKIMGYILESFARTSHQKGNLSRDVIKVQNIEKALDLIHSDYMKELTVNRAAEAAGYSKSNFCKIFKSIVGESFHKVLNKQRVKNACELLAATEMQVGAISQAVGFTEVKTFCRVFREISGVTPGEYRRRMRL